ALACLAALMHFAAPSHAVLPKMYEAQSGREALDAAKLSGKPIMVYFAQPGCGWCVAVEQLLGTSEVRFELVKNYHFVNVNIGASRDASAHALQKFLNVNGTPAFAFLSPKGEPICMVYGTIKDDRELARIDRNVLALVQGATTNVRSGGYPSCRGEVTEDDSRVTSIGGEAKRSP
ncbi:MAG: thioredoxin family protein, partial [Terriglobales bacterium]